MAGHQGIRFPGVDTLHWRILRPSNGVELGRGQVSVEECSSLVHNLDRGFDFDPLRFLGSVQFLTGKRARLADLSRLELYGKHEAPYMPMHLFSNVRWVCMILDLSIGAAQFYAMALIWPQMVSLYPSSITTTL